MNDARREIERTPRYIATLWGKNGPEVIGYTNEGQSLESFKGELAMAFAVEQAIPTYVIWQRAAMEGVSREA